MTTSSVRIERTDDGVDVTREYESLHMRRNTLGPRALARLNVGASDELGLTLLGIAREAVEPGGAQPLPMDLYDRVVTLGQSGTGTIDLPNSWTVVVAPNPDATATVGTLVVGIRVGPSSFRDGYSVLGIDRETTVIGNTVVAAGHTESHTDLTWQKAEHVVLTPQDRREVVALLLEQMDPVDRQDVIDAALDTESSNSRQHFIDTGAYLSPSEAKAAQA